MMTEKYSDKYRINSIKLHHVQVPVNLLFSYGSIKFFEFVIVIIKSGEYEGYGEGLILADNKWSNWLEQWAGGIINKDVRLLDNLLVRMENHNQRAICEAISIGLHDLLAKISNLPFTALIGGRKRESVPLMPCMFPENADDAKQLAKNLISQNAKYIKVKLVGDLQEDLSRVRSIRSVISDEIILQGDANCGYKTIGSAEQAVRALGDAGLNIFEDPLDGNSLDYASLRNKLDGKDSKIMLDVLTRDLNDFRDVLLNNSADMLNFHASEMGSMTSLLQRKKAAELFNKPYFIGGTGFCSVGSVAYQHIAASVSDACPVGELGVTTNQNSNNYSFRLERTP